MNKLNSLPSFLIKPSFLIAGVLLGTSTAAADLSFSNAPLFLESGVQPNIYFIVDDSGSMNWETLYTKGAQSEFYYPDNGSGSDTIELTPDIDDVGDSSETQWDSDNLSTRETEVRNSILKLCRGVNALHYNPEKNYTPWIGKDDDNDVYTDQTVTAALTSPYSSNTTKNLLLTEGDGDKSGYIRWLDLDSDGDVDQYVDMNKDGDVDFFIDQNGNNKLDFFVDIDPDGAGPKTPNGKYDGWIDLNGDNNVDVGELESETEFECPDPWYLTRKLNYSQARAENIIKQFLVTVESMDAAERTNYANWYSFYRKRKWVSKRALSSIISDSTARMGIDTIWNRKSEYVKDVDDITYRGDSAQDTLEMAAAKANKEDLLETMFSIGSSNGTPLRKSLKRAGEYFKTSNSNAPILSEPLGGSCQQNFTILFTDGVWNNNSPSVGNQDENSSNPFDGGLYADSYSNTLADVAMKYYKGDLRTDLDNEVPIIAGVDENPAQHMVTYTVAFGVSGNLDDDIKPGDTNWTGWPEPKSGKSSTIDDVRHAAYNGRGLFLNAQDPQELIDSLNSAISDIQARDASASAVSVNTGSISSTTMLFQAEFNSKKWTGRVNGVPLELDGSQAVDPSGNVVKHLASVVPDHNSRVIVTHNGTNGVPFKWANLTTDQQTIFGSSDVVEYLRGDDAKEVKNNGGIYRNREVLTSAGARGPLGDIVNSSPAYVGNPEFLYPDSLEAVPYSSFITDPDGDGFTKYIDHKAFVRNPVIYVGANDGMLHAFDVDPDKVGGANFGKEIFAYVPSAVM
jgi:type IV pilus assembly protein PilY1